MRLMLQAAITKKSPFRICFVCLGNICRSPTAEGVFQQLVNERSLQGYFEIDSAGTSAYHTGEGANHKSQQVANTNGVQLHSKSRKFKPFDLDYFDLLLAMDRDNLRNMRELDAAGSYRKKMMLLRQFDPKPENKEVPDPYSGGRQGFEKVYRVIERSCQNLLNELENHVEQ